MKNTISNLKTAAIISFITVLPFVILELTFNTSINVSDFTALFGFLWLSAAASVVVLMPVLQNVRAGNCAAAKPFNLLLRIAFSALVLTMWAGIIIDQLPCFLGAPSCD